MSDRRSPRHAPDRVLAALAVAIGILGLHSDELPALPFSLGFDALFALTLYVTAMIQAERLLSRPGARLREMRLSLRRVTRSAYLKIYLAIVLGNLIDGLEALVSAHGSSWPVESGAAMLGRPEALRDLRSFVTWAIAAAVLGRLCAGLRANRLLREISPVSRSDSFSPRPVP